MSAPGIYVHLPYCASRCGYCAFVVTTDASSGGRYIAALERETEIVAGEAAGSGFDSLYLGGGTPSLLDPGSIARTIAFLSERLAVSTGAEVTLEANPEDVDADRVRAWVDAGVNRVSVGVQSLADSELSAVGRRHDAARARAALATLADAGLRRGVSGDLILGLPLQTPESFRESLEGLRAAGVGHVSVYLLETEKSKAIEEDRREHPERYMDDDAQANVWLETGERLAADGYRHYEVSNWARPGLEAWHNLKYWTRTPTIGLGVSAHELWGGRRRANVASLERYLAEVEGGRRATALDREVDDAEAAREAIVLGLRLADGVSAPDFAAAVSRPDDSRLPEDAADWLSGGILERDDGRVRFTERGFLISNEVLSRLV